MANERLRTSTLWIFRQLCLSRQCLCCTYASSRLGSGRPLCHAGDFAVIDTFGRQVEAATVQPRRRYGRRRGRADALAQRDKSATPAFDRHQRRGKSPLREPRSTCRIRCSSDHKRNAVAWRCRTFIGAGKRGRNGSGEEESAELVGKLVPADRTSCFRQAGICDPAARTTASAEGEEEGQTAGTTRLHGVDTAKLQLERLPARSPVEYRRMVRSASQ